MAMIQEAMQADAAAPQGKPQPQPQGQPEGGRGGEPPMKAVENFRRLGVSMMKVIYDKKTTPHLLNIIRGSDDPVAGVVQAAMVVVKALGEKVKGLQPDAAMAILPPTLSFLFEMADAAKLLQYQPAMMEQAMQMLSQNAQGAQPAPQTEEAPAGEAPAPVEA